MFQFLHHIQYVVRNLAEMVEYLDKNFGMKPTEIIEHRGVKEAFYDVVATYHDTRPLTDPTGNKRMLPTRRDYGVIEHGACAVLKLMAMQARRTGQH